uniref:Uncharacterized protein n=1 Tax=Globodera rostochiensis TaxID=31243 RepID=A0A914I3G6_GLORO
MNTYKSVQNDGKRRRRWVGNIGTNLGIFATLQSLLDFVYVGGSRSGGAQQNEEIGDSDKANQLPPTAPGGGGEGDHHPSEKDSEVDWDSLNQFTFIVAKSVRQPPDGDGGLTLLGQILLFNCPRKAHVYTLHPCPEGNFVLSAA